MCDILMKWRMDIQASVKVKHVVQLLCIVGLVTVLFIVYGRSKYDRNTAIREEIEKYPEQRPEMEDMLSYGPLMSHEVPLGKSIFFIDLSGNNFISPRMACAVESAGRAIEHYKVFILLTSKDINLQDEATLSLFAVPNVYYRQVDPNRYFSKIRLSEWYRNEMKENSKDLPRIEDALKLALLHYHGGIAMDSDMLLFRDVSTFPDFVVLQTRNMASTAIMKFQDSSTFLENMLRELPSRLQTHRRSSVDPLSQFMRDVCHVEILMQLHNSDCSHAPLVQPPAMFFPVSFEKRRTIYDPIRSSLVMNKVEGCYGMKTWASREESGVLYKKKGDTAFKRLAKNNCPMVYFTLSDQL